MDPTALLESIGISKTTAAMLVAVAAIVIPWAAAILPPTVPGRKLLDFLAANVLNARNATPAASTTPPIGAGSAVVAMLLLPALAACSLTPQQGAQVQQALAQAQAQALPSLACLVDEAGALQHLANGANPVAVQLLQNASTASLTFATDTQCQAALAAFTAPAPAVPATTAAAAVAAASPAK